MSITDLILDNDENSEKEKVYVVKELIRGEDPEGSLNGFKDIYVTFKRYFLTYNNKDSILFVMTDVTTHHKLREA